MNVMLLLVTSGIYGWVAFGYAMQQRWGMCAAFIAYAVANVGFAIDASQTPIPPQ
jgi:hypothetical protein